MLSSVLSSVRLGEFCQNETTLWIKQFLKSAVREFPISYRFTVKDSEQDDHLQLDRLCRTGVNVVWSEPLEIPDLI